MLHALRLRGVAEAAAIAEMMDVELDSVARELATLEDADLVAYRHGRIAGFTQTPEGRAVGDHLLRSELAEADVRVEVEELYQNFLGCNDELLAVCFAWQVRDDDGEQVRNDHSDTAYDDQVRERLVAVHDTVDPVLAALEGALVRMGGHRRPPANCIGPRARRRPRLVHEADVPELPLDLVRVARRPARDPRHRSSNGRNTLMGTLPPARFGRVLTAMITPFDLDGRLDLDGAQVLARWLVDHGSDGLVVNGTTGESPTLSPIESIDLFRAVRQAVDVPVIAGTGSNDTAHAIRQSEAASGIGVDGLLVVAPYYNKPSQAGLDRHFRLIAQATELPVILYDIPGRTGRKVETSTLVGLAHDVPTIVALKDAGGSPAETATLVAAAPDDFEVYSGDDNLTLPMLAVGACGAISVASHWAGLHLRAMFEAFDAGDVAEACRINQRLLPSYVFESSLEAPNPVPAKAMLRTLDLPSGECRPPMGPTPDGLEAEAKELWAALEG